MTARTEVPGALVFERVLPHPPEKIWRALTQGPLLEQWLMANDFRPVVGHRFTFRLGPQPRWDGLFTGEVLIAEPPERLAYRWNTQAGGQPSQTVVTWTLNAVPGGVLLRMEQSGFQPQERQNHQGARQAWPQFLKRLERLLTALD